MARKYKRDHFTSRQLDPYDRKPHVQPMAHICEEPDYKLTSKHIYNLQNTTYSSSRNALTWKVSATEENPGCQQSIQLEIDRDYLKNQSLSSSSFDKISSIA